MIEELNLLAVRIGQLVEKLRTLSGEAQSLRQQVEHLKTERDSLVSELQVQQADAKTLKVSLGEAVVAVEKSRNLAEQEKSALQGSLDLFRQENETMQSNLATRDTEVKRLREVNAQARQRIEGVLERLPGAVQQEMS